MWESLGNINWVDKFVTYFKTRRWNKISNLATLLTEIASHGKDALLKCDQIRLQELMLSKILQALRKAQDYIF